MDATVLTSRPETLRILRGERVKRLRSATRYSRRAFEKKYAIKASSLQSWEAGRYGGLSENGAHELAEAFQQEGFSRCTPEWLLYGVGEDPLLARPNATDPSFNTQAFEGSLFEQLEAFHKTNKSAMHTMIRDESMAPYLYPGDYVAGCRSFGEAIAALAERVCIVETVSGNVWVRKLMKGSQANHYDLHIMEPSGKSVVSETNVRLFSAAQIIWVRTTTVSLQTPENPTPPRRPASNPPSSPRNLVTTPKPRRPGI